MLRNISVSGGESYEVDSVYVLPDNVADSFISDGHAEFVENVADDEKQEAEPIKAKQPAKKSKRKPLK